MPLLEAVGKPILAGNGQDENYKRKFLSRLWHPIGASLFLLLFGLIPLQLTKTDDEPPTCINLNKLQGADSLQWTGLVCPLATEGLIRVRSQSLNRAASNGKIINSSAAEYQVESHKTLIYLWMGRPHEVGAGWRGQIPTVPRTTSIGIPRRHRSNQRSR